MFSNLYLFQFQHTIRNYGYLDFLGLNVIGYVTLCQFIPSFIHVYVVFDGPLFFTSLVPFNRRVMSFYRIRWKTIRTRVNKPCHREDTRVGRIADSEYRCTVHLRLSQASTRCKETIQQTSWAYTTLNSTFKLFFVPYVPLVAQESCKYTRKHGCSYHPKKSIARFINNLDDSTGTINWKVEIF